MNIKLAFLGDIYSASGLENYWLSDDLRQILLSHDLVSCNLEAPLTIASTPESKIGPSLKQPPSVNNQCLTSGINIFNLANNHLMDHGSPGVKSSLDSLKDTKSNYLGIGYKPISFKLHGLTITLISGCEHEFGVIPSFELESGVAWINDPQIDSNIIHAKANGHFVVIQAHAGEEASLPLPEWRSRYQHLIDLGADLVIAHHPHAPQGWEKYHHKMIYYSLGNFYFLDPIISSSSKGIIVSLSIAPNHTYKVKVIPTLQTHNQVQSNLSAMKNLQKLSRQIISKSYIAQANKQALMLWKRYYSKYYLRSVSSNPLSNLLGNKFNYPMILHNQMIESHRWTINRALNQLIKNK